MSTKLTLKLVKSLQIKKFRQEHGLFLVEGRKSVFELLQSGVQIAKIYTTPAFYEEFVTVLSTDKFSIEQITEHELSKIGSLENNNQILAVVPIPAQEPINFDADTILALDSIQDPGNMGTIIRIADWFGIEQIVCSKNCVDIYNPKTVSATMGSFIRVKVTMADLKSVIEISKNRNFKVLGAMLNGIEISTVNFSKTLIVLGSESHGISPELVSMLDQRITIRGFGKAESLNVGVSCGIILHQATQKA